MISAGFLASLGLSGFYYLVLWLLTKDAGYPLRQFLALQPWMSLLVLGFGIQWALFAKLKQGKMVASGNSVVSGAGMVSCCAHHAVEALPFLGLTGGAAFLVNYQKELLIIGILSNLLGIGYLMWWLKPQLVRPLVLETKIINLGKVEISATPTTIKPNEPIVFKLALTTHSVELSYDFTQIIKAEDDKGNTYTVSGWSGGSGGHHLEGELTLSSLQPKTKQLKLNFSGIDNQSGDLSWELERR